MRKVYHKIIHIAGNVITVEADDVAYNELAEVTSARGVSLAQVIRLADGKVEALEFRVTEGAACIGIPLKSLKLKPNVLVCAVIRGDRSIIPDGETTICAGDHAIIVSSAGKLKTIDGIVDK